MALSIPQTAIPTLNISCELQTNYALYELPNWKAQIERSILKHLLTRAVLQCRCSTTASSSHTSNLRVRYDTASGGKRIFYYCSTLMHVHNFTIGIVVQANVYNYEEICNSGVCWMIVSSSEKKDRSNLGIMRFSRIIKRSKVFKNSQDGYAPSILNLLVYSLRSISHCQISIIE